MHRKSFAHKQLKIFELLLGPFSDSLGGISPVQEQNTITIQLARNLIQGNVGLPSNHITMHAVSRRKKNQTQIQVQGQERDVPARETQELT